MIIAAMALLAESTLPPPLRKKVDTAVEPIELPWHDKSYVLQCDVTDSEMRRGRLTLTLGEPAGWVPVRVTGDAELGLNMTASGETSVYPLYGGDPDVVRRYVSFDGPNATYAIVKQAFDHGVLKSTSFEVRYTSRSVGGVADMNQAMGFCAPAKSENEAVR